jgi:serine/threonine protein phosphatase PrpC
MSDQEICDVIQRTEDPNDAAHCLTDAALHYSSEDNATAIVVPLGSWGNSNQIFFSNIQIALTRFFSFQK